MTSVLAHHIDTPQQRHRLVLLDERHLRCHDCAHTLVLPTGPSPVPATSTSNTPPRPDQTCPTHLGHRDSCAGCAADAKATDNGRPVPAQPTADVAAGAAAARAALTAARSRREGAPT